MFENLSADKSFLLFQRPGLKLWDKDGISDYLLKADMGGVQEALWQHSQLM